MNSKSTINVAITGAAGQIGYALIFRLLKGEMTGNNIKIRLQLIENNDEKSLKSLSGVMMEIEDCAFPLLDSMSAYSDPVEGFRDVDFAFLIGAKPRGPGMERKELLKANAKIFKIQGYALNKTAKKSVKVLVIGNPANTNAYITMQSAPDIPKKNFSAMMRLDHNRALAQISNRFNTEINEIKKLCVWGNHSPTMFVDTTNTYIKEKGSLKNSKLIIESSKETLISMVANRGAEIIKMRGLSSAASAASAAIDHMRDWINGNDDWVTMGIPSSGEYGIPQDIIFGFPVICKDGDYKIVEKIELNEEAKLKIKLSLDELLEEKESVISLLSGT